MQSSGTPRRIRKATKDYVRILSLTQKNSKLVLTIDLLLCAIVERKFAQKISCMQCSFLEAKQHKRNILMGLELNR